LRASITPGTKHVIRSGSADQVEAERVTAVANNLLLLSRGAGRLSERGDVEATVVRYRAGALVLAPLGDEFGLAVLVGSSASVADVAHALSRFCSRAVTLLPTGSAPVSDGAVRGSGRDR